MIVDEVQTGIGATGMEHLGANKVVLRMLTAGSAGKFWAHEWWNLDTPPDIVTFSKKAQTAGYFYGDDAIRPSQGYRQYNLPL
jgi:4-aminobutyrate aminotransferase / (S)-3-amino-2-methylpropionate transaminase